MSGNPTPSAKPSRRQRLLAHLPFKSRASSPSPSPSSWSNRNVTSSTAQIVNSPFTQAVSSSAAPPGPVFGGLLTAGAAPLPSSQATPTSSSNPNLLHNVLKRLSEDDRATLQNCIFQDASDTDLALEQALAAAKEKQRYCVEKRWTFIFEGRTVVLKEKADKVVGWLNRFAKVGDIVANVDPVHMGLPWAGIRLLLEVKPILLNKLSSNLTLSLTGCRIRGESDDFTHCWMRDCSIYSE